MSCLTRKNSKSISIAHSPEQEVVHPSNLHVSIREKKAQKFNKSMTQKCQMRNYQVKMHKLERFGNKKLSGGRTYTHNNSPKVVSRNFEMNNKDISEQVRTIQRRAQEIEQEHGLNPVDANVEDQSIATTEHLSFRYSIINHLHSTQAKNTKPFVFKQFAPIKASPQPERI